MASCILPNVVLVKERLEIENHELEIDFEDENDQRERGRQPINQRGAQKREMQVNMVAEGISTWWIKIDVFLFLYLISLEHFLFTCIQVQPLLIELIYCLRCNSVSI